MKNKKPTFILYYQKTTKQKSDDLSEILFSGFCFRYGKIIERSKFKKYLKT